ncbi:MAG TPA: transcriptional repressor LexA [Hydrogenispora sp.]|jgi:repressor LexA|nr:transcriptional repressor LexA [Hydrogenispora sp.]
MEDLNQRQQEILDYIIKETQIKGYPPSVREIGEAVGLSSSSSVHAHLEKLQQLGYIRRDPTKPRAIEILKPPPEAGELFYPEVIPVPIVGRVTAGEPILAVENIEEYYPLPKDFTSYRELFILKVKGDSMINAGIFDQDLVVVNKTTTANNGEIVVALLDNGEATVKRFFKEAGKFRLQPENPVYQPIYTEDLSILGRVIGLIRKF